MRIPSRVALVLCLAISLAACGGGGAGEVPADGTSAAASEAAVEAATITAEELTAYERGFAREMDAVRAAQQKAASAPTAQERNAAMQAQWETATIPLGAEAAGLDEARYRAIRTVVHDTLRDLDFKGEIDGPLSIDLSRVDEATKARLSRDVYAGLPADSAAALRAAIPRLAPAWIEYTTLTAVAG
jgi:hypothetical protein